MDASTSVTLIPTWCTPSSCTPYPFLALTDCTGPVGPFISGLRRPMKWMRADRRHDMTATMAPGLDDRLAGISRLADELRIVSRLQFGTPINVPAWPEPDHAWAPRRVSSRTV